MKLAFKKIGQGYPLLILHGLYGSSDNWHSIGTELAKKFEVYLIDMRNHGRSPHSNEHNYLALQNDVLEFYTSNNIKKAIIIGHSMGGKTAMQFALLHPDLVEKLIIVDIAPKSYTSLLNFQSQALIHLNIMQAFLSVDISKMKSREDLEAEFANYVTDKQTRLFLLKNAVRTDDGFKWKLNIEGLSNALPRILESIELKKTDFSNDINIPTLFIKGEKSDYIIDSDIQEIKRIFPKADLVTIFDAGHWVHAEQPELFLKTIGYFLDENM
jgi:esterase